MQQQYCHKQLVLLQEQCSHLGDPDGGPGQAWQDFQLQQLQGRGQDTEIDEDDRISKYHILCHQG